MGPNLRDRPVEAPLTSSSPRSSGAWPAECRELAVQLQRRLSIGDRDWHALKGQRSRRAAEQLAAALVQLLSGDDPQQSAPTQPRQEATALTEHALRWLKAEINDPGCPSHQRSRENRSRENRSQTTHS
jgi:hypothetical protein